MEIISSHILCEWCEAIVIFLMMYHSCERRVELRGLRPGSDLAPKKSIDIMYRVFQQQCRVKVIPQATFQNHNYGQAYVIFKAKDKAEQVVKAINGGCLMLSQGRPLISSIGMLKIPAKASALVGHLPTYRGRFQVQREEMKYAVSTSHGSQPNTMEYDLALKWFLLQDKYLLAQKLLHENQLKERTYFRNHFKSK